MLPMINLYRLVWQLKMYSSNFSAVASGDGSGTCERTNQGFQRAAAQDSVRKLMCLLSIKSCSVTL